jgi:hypothetical protein
VRRFIHGACGSLENEGRKKDPKIVPIKTSFSEGSFLRVMFRLLDAKLSQRSTGAALLMEGTGTPSQGWRDSVGSHAGHLCL